jgi:hypothetical protein
MFAVGEADLRLPMKQSLLNQGLFIGVSLP